MNTHANESPQALAGLRVLELSDEKGQQCGKLLADLGATVIKVEPPEGSPSRYVGPFFNDRNDVNASLHFWHYNTNKRSITLDTASPKGRRLLLRLMKTADVIIETLPPGTMAARGLGYAQAQKANPRIVYCSITPYGQSGPWAGYAGSDLTLLASGGIMALCGYDPADDPRQQPIAPGGGNALLIGDGFACLSILAAIHMRGVHGNGNFIDVSIQEAVALCTEVAFPMFSMTGQEQVRHTGRHAIPTDLPKIQFLCKDGRYVNCFTPRLDPDGFIRLRAWLAKHNLAGELMNERLTDPEVLITSMMPVFEAVGRLASLCTARDFCTEAQRIGLPWTIVQAPSDLLDDAHLKARKFFVDVSHPEIGKAITYPGAPYKLHGAPWRVRRRAPLLGEDNITVYHDELGLSLTHIKGLDDAGVI